LVAALAFLDAARENTLHARELVSWLDRYLVRPGLMPMPSTVQESEVVSLREVPTGAWAAPFEVRLSRIVAGARVRVSVALEGLLADPPDDRFLSAAIFAGRVERGGGAHGPGWRAHPKGTDKLSDIVLSIFAADALTHREEYDQNLCVCGICGRVALVRTRGPRTRCAQHVSSLPGVQRG
jgi:hypothetical protein